MVHIYILYKARFCTLCAAKTYNSYKGVHLPGLGWPVGRRPWHVRHRLAVRAAEICLMQVLVGASGWLCMCLQSWTRLHSYTCTAGNCVGGGAVANKPRIMSVGDGHAQVPRVCNSTRCIRVWAEEHRSHSAWGARCHSSHDSKKEVQPQASQAS